MNFKVRRYQPGQPLFSDSEAFQGDRYYKAIFGELCYHANEPIHFTMERADTLIPEGTYNYSLYDSPANRCVVLLLHDVPGFSEIEHHIANFPYELKGCTAHGMKIDIKTPELLQSKIAFDAMMKIIKDAYPDAKPGDIIGTITYEKFIEQLT